MQNAESAKVRDSQTTLDEVFQAVRDEGLMLIKVIRTIIKKTIVVVVPKIVIVIIIVKVV